MNTTMTTTAMAAKTATKLLPEWEVKGTDIESFYEELEDLDKRTTILNSKLNEVAVLSLLSPKSLNDKFGINKIKDGRWAVYVLNVMNVRDKEAVKDSYGNSIVFGVPKDSVVITESKKERKALEEETEGNGFLLSIPEKTGATIFPLSAWAVKDLFDRAGIKGNITRKGLIRDKWLVDNFTTNPISLVIREDGEMKKIMSIRGRVFTQCIDSSLTPTIRVVHEFLEKELGESSCQGWEVNNLFSEVTLAFPEKAEEIRDFYPELPPDITPIIRITNSDVGYSPLLVEAGFRIGDSNVFSKKGTAKTIHNKDFLDAKIISEIRKNVFPEFLTVPKELARLIGIDIINVEVAIDELLDFIKIKKESGLKFIGEALKDLLTVELGLGSYTAYDIVKAVLSSPDRLVLTKKSNGEERVLPESTKQALNEVLARAIYCPFKTQEETEVFLFPE